MPYILVAPLNSPFASSKDVIEAARKQPGKLNLGSAGAGTLQHMTGELFKLKAGIEMLTVQYKGTTPALADVAGGSIDLFFSDPSGLQLIQGGRVKALGVTGQQRYAFLPQVPTVAESGLPAFEATTWYPLMAPAHTPAPIIERLNQATMKVMDSKEVKDALHGAGFIPTPMKPSELGAFIQSENTRWSEVIKSAKITIQ